MKGRSHWFPHIADPEVKIFSHVARASYSELCGDLGAAVHFAQRRRNFRSANRNPPPRWQLCALVTVEGKETLRPPSEESRPVRLARDPSSSDDRRGLPPVPKKPLFSLSQGLEINSFLAPRQKLGDSCFLFPCFEPRKLHSPPIATTDLWISGHQHAFQPFTRPETCLTSARPVLRPLPIKILFFRSFDYLTTSRLRASSLLYPFLSLFPIVTYSSIYVFVIRSLPTRARLFLLSWSSISIQSSALMPGTLH